MKISIEYGHSYFSSAPYAKSLRNGEDNSPSRDLTESEKTNLDTAVLLYDELEGQGHDVSSVVLIDDVAVAHMHRRVHDSDRVVYARARVHQAIRELFSPDTIESEDDFSLKGQAYAEALANLADELGILTNGARINIQTRSGKQKIKLAGFKDVDDITVPSCEVLDLAFQIHRAHQNDLIITLLPEGFRKQQDRVDALASLLKHDELTDRFKDATPNTEFRNADPAVLAETGRATIFLQEDGTFDVCVYNSPNPETDKVFEGIKELLTAKEVNHVIDQVAIQPKGLTPAQA